MEGETETEEIVTASGEEMMMRVEERRSSRGGRRMIAFVTAIGIGIESGRGTVNENGRGRERGTERGTAIATGVLICLCGVN